MLSLIYLGWFQVVDEKTNKVTEHGFKTLGDIVDGGMSQVLLVREVASGFREDEKTGVMSALVIPPGEILRISHTWTKEWKTDALDKSAIKSTRLLKCYDLMHKVIHIPITHHGKPFSLVGSLKDPTNPKLAYQIRNVIELWKPQTIIKLLFGWPPQGINEFNGYLRITSITRPDCAIVYNFRSEMEVLLEIPLDINIKVQMAENHVDFIKCEAYQNVLEICQNKIYPYVVNMKVSNIPYQALHIEQVTGEDGEHVVKIRRTKYANKENTKYMCLPRDMTRFEPKVYPSVNDHHISNTWRIVYRDPDHVYEDYKTLDLGSQGETYIDNIREFPDDQTMLQHVFLEMSLTHHVDLDGSRGSKVSGKGSTGPRRKNVMDVFSSDNSKPDA